jgi:NADPH:quinone reductase-like Zn-dependent oxidoreductase
MASAAVALIGFGTAADALFRLGRVKAGETVIIQGAAGGVGLCAVQLAHKAGARVIGTGSTTTSLEQLRTYGLDEALATADGPISDRVMALTGGRGADLLIDTVGGPALQDGVNALANGGRAIMVGRIAAGEHKVDAFQLMTQRKSLIGCMFGQILDTPEIGQLVDDLLERVATGELKSVIDAEFPLSRAVDAHRRAEVRGRIGRVVMLP